MVLFSEDHTLETCRRGRIEVICGSMFSGKTEELIRRLKRASFAKQRVEIFKPAIDTRYSNDEVISHDRNSIQSTPIDSSASILLFSSEIDVVGIDEAQFFDEAGECLQRTGQPGHTGHHSRTGHGLQGNTVRPHACLCAIADEVTKVHAICVRCGDLAYISHRIIASDKRVLLGEKEEYEPLCRCCYQKAIKQAEGSR